MLNKQKKEKNIDKFNSDVSFYGSYQYTTHTKLSAEIATKRQSDEIVKFLNLYSPKNATLLDVGCGDGTFTVDLLQAKKVKKIIAFDMAHEAIILAKKAFKKYKRDIVFQTANIYESRTMFSNKNIDIAVVRGVLHHLYNPKKAIKQLSFLPVIIVLEPNGYNPILKIIEKISPYHRIHEEKSYFPPFLNGWFQENGYKVVAQKFVGIVPYFFPDVLTKLLIRSEPFFERVPFFKIFYTGTNVIVYKKFTNFSSKH